ncbi:hypothetical protein VTN31DRAFT_5006 [Thermomyces dupontii]|uniref:uncharacterized protein n=1 Tax=Talaromyces thermophilus TaxID=28565 RepID=UPI0037433AA6
MRGTERRGTEDYPVIGHFWVGEIGRQLSGAVSKAGFCMDEIRNPTRTVLLGPCPSSKLTRFLLPSTTACNTEESQ